MNHPEPIDPPQPRYPVAGMVGGAALCAAVCWAGFRDGGEVGFDIGLSMALVGPNVVLLGIVHGWHTRRCHRRFRELRASRLVHWTYDPGHWDRFVSGEFRLVRREEKWSRVIVMGIGALAAFLAVSEYGPPAAT